MQGRASGQGMCKGSAPSSFARISLISVMRDASSAAANAAARGRNDAAAAVPMAARRPSGRAGVSAEVPTSSVTARVVSMKGEECEISQSASLESAFHEAQVQLRGR